MSFHAPADAGDTDMGVADESWFSYIAPTRSGGDYIQRAVLFRTLDHWVAGAGRGRMADCRGHGFCTRAGLRRFGQVVFFRGGLHVALSSAISTARLWFRPERYSTQPYHSELL